MSTSADGTVRVFAQDDGRWRWSWDDSSGRGALVANETFAAAAEAAEAATEAYPGAAVDRPDETSAPPPRRRRRRLLLVVGVAVAAYAAGRRRAGRR